MAGENESQQVAGVEPGVQPSPWDKAKLGFAAAGFTPDEIDQVGKATHDHLVGNGSEQNEIEDFFGMNKKPIVKPIQDYFDKRTKENLPPLASGGSHPPDTLINALKTGWGSSIAGLTINQAEGDNSLTENSPWYNRLASGVAQGVGDAPAYIAGTVAGAGLGAPAGPVGSFVGAASVGMGLPQGLRAAMIQNYRQGGVQNFSQFMEVMKQGAIEGGKGLLTGAVSAPFGALGGKVVAKIAPAIAEMGAGTVAEKATPYVANLLTKSAPVASELAAMTTVGGALDGHLPSLRDFGDNAMMLGAMHYSGINRVQGKLMDTFSSTGLHPEEVTREAMTNPVVRQEMIALDPGTPGSFKDFQAPEITHSTFGVVNGRLVKASDPAYHAQLGFDLEPTSHVELEHDAQETFSDQNVRMAAKAHDPEAFRMLSEQSAQTKAAIAQIKANGEALARVQAGESRGRELEEVQGKLAFPEKFTKNIEEHQALKAREQELLQSRSKDRKDMAAADAIRAHNEAIQNEMNRIRNNPELKERLVAAHNSAKETLRNNWKDKIQNKRIVLHDAPGTDLLPGLNPEFNDPSHEIPEMTDAGKKILLEDPDQMDFTFQMGGAFTKSHTREESLALILKDHPELAKETAPEIVHEVPGPTTSDAEGKTTEGESSLYVAARGLMDESSSPRGPVEKKLVVRPSIPNERGLSLSGARRLFDTLFVSKLSPWHDVEKGVNRSDRLATDIAHQGASYNRALDMMENGVLGEKGSRTTKSLNEVFKFKTTEERNKFGDYLVYREAQKELNAGRRAGEVTSEEAAHHIAEYEKAHPEFKERAAQVHDFLDKFLDYAEKKGVLTEGSAEKFRSKYGRDYLPLNHVGDEGNLLGGKLSSDPFKKRMGSDKDFLDPYESIRNKVTNTVYRIEMNENANKAYELNESLPPDAKILTEFRPEEESSDTIRTGEIGRKLKEDEVSVVKDGKFGVMRFKDPELAMLLKTGGMSGAELSRGVQRAMDVYNFVTKYTGLEAAANLTRAGVSLSSKFAPVHIIRQEVEGWLLSRTSNVDQFVKKMIGKENATPEELHAGRIPFITTMQTLTHLVYDKISKGTEINQHPDIIRARIHKSLDGVMSEVYDNLEKTKKYQMGDEYGGVSGHQNLIKSAWHMNHTFIDLWSKAQRLSEFKMLEEQQKQSLGRELTDEELNSIGKQSRGVNVDALEKGAAIGLISKIAPFTTYGTNGFFNTVNVYREDPINAAIKTAVFLGAVGAMKYVNRNDDEINEISREQTDNYIPMRVNGDVIARIPKSWGMFKVLSALMERGIDHFAKNDPEAFKGMGETLIRDLPFPAPPSAYGIYQALHNNYNTYSGKAMIPEYLMKGAPETRAFPYTSQTARGIGHMVEQLNGLPVIGHALNSGLNAYGLGSPANIDYLANQLGGSRAEQLLHLIDTGLAKAGITDDNAYSPWSVADLPYVGGLVQRNPTYNAKSFTDLKEKLGEVAPYHKQMKDAEAAGDLDTAEQIRDKHPEVEQFDQLNSASRDIQLQLKALRAIDQSKDMSPNEKKSTTEDIYKAAWLRAKDALESMREGE